MNDVIMGGVQTLVIKFDQEASVMDVKNALMRELRSIEGFKVMPEESQVGASAANRRPKPTLNEQTAHGEKWTWDARL